MNDADREPRILLTRLSAIGDCILTLPLVCALRDHFPHCQLVWAVEPLAATLIDGHAAVDETLVIPKGWLTSPQRVWQLRHCLRARQFDLVLDPQSLTKSSMLGWLSGAPRRIGFASPQGRELAPWLDNEHVTRGSLHIVDATLKLLEPLGIEHPRVRFDVPTNRAAESRMEEFVRDSHLGEGFAVINSAASWPSKQWPAARFGRVARHLGEQHNLPCVVTWAGSHEADLARQIIAKSGGHAIQAADTSLLELAVLLRRARLVIGSDTGPLHLAAAAGTPCLGLYGPTRREKSGPYGPQHAVLQVDCPRIRNRRQRQRDDAAMRQISVEAACDACDELLRRPPQLRWQSHAA